MTTDGSSEETAAPDRFDVLRYGPDDHRVVPAGDGAAVVGAHESELRHRRLFGSVAVALLCPFTTVLFGAAYLDAVVGPAVVGLVAGLLAAGVRYRRSNGRDAVPEVVAADASERVVREYVDAFDPDRVSDPFE